MPGLRALLRPERADHGAPGEHAHEPIHQSQYHDHPYTGRLLRPGRGAGLLEQLVELSVSQNQLLVDLLGAVNALTAALLAKL